uniref:Membrane protein, palmitoylated 3 (MAGUK p55 subfamily member 3) n=1 Tax=Callorhinchus milii TaxID=7868 RepID=V9KJS0_CALMI
MPVLSSGTGLHEVLALLTAQLRPDANLKEEISFLTEVFSEKSFNSLMKIHEKLRHFDRHTPSPTLYSAATLVHELSEELQNGPMGNDVSELLQLLAKPHVKALLTAHDTVACKAFDPVLPPMPDDVGEEEEEESVKIVRLVKDKEPLGATIRMDEQTSAVVVARIMRGGAADRSGLVHVGDELREVNGITVENKSPEEISQILAQCQGSITLKIIPALKEEDRLKESKVYMRALFDYDPSKDKAIPCKEAGLPFRKLNILQVVSRDDAVWWQAKRVGNTNLRAGLIPSKQFEERRFKHRRAMALEQQQEMKQTQCEQANEREDCDCDGYFNGLHVAGLRRSFRLSRKERRVNQSEAKMSEPEELLEVPTYEEVTRYHRRPTEYHRLVVLVGSLGAKINEMKQKLIAENPNRYCVAVPSTTRQKKVHEREGVEYHFLSKLTFEAEIQSNRFVEHGEYNNNLYGITVDSIRTIQLKKKICLVDAQPQTIKNLRTPEFKPYVIFIKPFIQEMRTAPSADETPEEKMARIATEEEQREMIQMAEDIEHRYGHLIDRILVKGELQTACNELKHTLDNIEKETLWVPVSWVRS